MKKLMGLLCLALYPCIIYAGPQSIKYKYDELGRLTFVEDNVNGNRDYDYDAAGNRTALNVGVEDEGSNTVVPEEICYATIPYYNNSTLTYECSEATRPWNSQKTSVCNAKCPQ